jgi:hypothetical protein
MTARKYGPICSYPECGRPHNARGLCGAHGAMQRRGETLRPLQNRTGPIARTAAARFADKVRVAASGCHVWTGGKTLNGYGTFAVETAHRGGTRDLAHRWAYEQTVGPIPAGYDIDHLCRNRACVNVEHLEPVTRQENIRRAAAAKTACHAGHPYTPENTYVRPGTVHRTCRICAHARNIARAPIRNARRRAARAAERERTDHGHL